MEYYITTTADYWIAPNAVQITLNALGNKNRIQGSVASGAVIMCFVDSIRAESEGGEEGNGDGLWYGADHQPKSWPLNISPTYFNSDTHKYVYAAIPRRTTVGTQAVIVFPSEELDIYGRAFRGYEEDSSSSSDSSSSDSSSSEELTPIYEQVGSTDYFYVFLQGIISAPGGYPEHREWERPITDWGKLDTPEGNEERRDSSEWYHYENDVVTLLKEIVMADTSSFRNLNINGKSIIDIATNLATDPIDSDTMVTTPNYVSKFFLSKVNNDVAQGTITFLNGLVAYLQSTFENIDFSGILRSEGASTGMDGTGIFMDALRGYISADGLDVRGFMRVAKFIYNMIQVMEQDYTFSGGGDIESVTDNGNGTYTLAIHKEKEGRHTSFGDGDILCGKMDTDPVSGQAYEYITSWMRVADNGVTFNDGLTPDTVVVELWDDDMVPGGENFAPRSMMTVARRGNVTDENRQDYWELSTTDKRLTFYWHVDQPILRADNYALCYGILPTILDDAGILPSTRDASMPSLYVSEIFYEHAHHIHYPARVVKEDRGQWTDSPTAEYEGEQISDPYHFESYSQPTWLMYRNNASYASLTDEQLLNKMRYEWKVDLETSRVWNNNILWECLVEGTTQEPCWGCSDWVAVSGGIYKLSITATKRILRARYFNNGAVASTLGFVLTYGAEDISSQIPAGQAIWTRQSPGWEDDPTLANSDELWNAAHRYGNLTIGVTSSDLPLNWASAREVQFTLHVGTNDEDVYQVINLH